VKFRESILKNFLAEENFMMTIPDNSSCGAVDRPVIMANPVFAPPQASRVFSWTAAGVARQDIGGIIPTTTIGS
jgi:hypothetical protein